MKTLTTDEIKKALVNLSGWKQEGERLIKILIFKDFSDAVVFVNEVAQLAEEVNHHPDIHISYNKVSLELSTHDAGGITRRDVKLAGKIDEIGK